MSTHDTNGKEWLRVDQAKAGVKVITDGGFTCMREGVIKTIYIDPKYGPTISCSDITHDLDGQLNDEGTHYVGLYLCDKPPHPAFPA